MKSSDLNLGSIQGGPGGPPEGGEPSADELAGMIPPSWKNVDPSKIAEMNENEEAKQQLKLTEHINKMEAEYQGRFKALKVIQNMMHEADEEEQKAIRVLEVEYERKYAEIYSLRNKYINSEIPTSQDLV